MTTTDHREAGDAGVEAPELPALRPRRARGARRRAVLTVVVVLAVPFALLAAGGVWVQRQLDPPGEPGAEVRVAVEEGWGVSQIADELEATGVVDTALVFQLYARVTGAGPFQAGEYELREDLGARDAVAALDGGPTIVYRDLAVPPGLWLTEIAERVGRLPGRSAEEFLRLARSGEVRSKYQPPEVNTLEGLLFPDTYKVSDSEDEREILTAMVRRFEEVGDRIGLDRAAVEGRSPYEIATVASLVQSEAGIEADRPLISSVVYNRLRDGTPLQIDATVLYAIGQRKPTNTAEDRAVESPYNTYQAAGLPPTPISSVAEASLLAAMNPASTPYRFYVLIDENGTHRFATTYEEHLRNVEEARSKGLLG